MLGIFAMGDHCLELYDIVLLGISAMGDHTYFKGGHAWYIRNGSSLHAPLDYVYGFA